MIRRRYLIGFAVFSSLAPAAAQEKMDPVVLGELLFFTCTSCHNVGERSVAKVSPHAGPHLNDLFGRKPGSLPDYQYSEAMVTFGQNNIWDVATLMTFLRDPSGVVAGTKMNYPGNKKDEELQALLAYLVTFDPDGMAMD